MLTLAATLFAAGLLTILLPCILPLIPVVLGMSIVDRHPLRPLMTVAGMLVSFVAFTFVLQVLLSRFVALAVLLQVGTFYVLLLFGVGFLTESRVVRLAVTVAGAFFFWERGWLAVGIAAVFGIIAMEVGGMVASRIQQLGADTQGIARNRFGAQSPVTAFLIGLTLGLVWVPCAGPALSFALALVRDQPGPKALALLSAYALGAGVPLLIVGYGGQWAVRSVRFLSRYSLWVKRVSGVLLIVSAIAFRYQFFTALQLWLTENTAYGSIASRLEDGWFAAPESPTSPPSSSDSMVPSTLPRISRAPEFVGLGPWHNGQPLTLASLKGKVVLVDFWTYSCINCIRTLPYIQGYWDKYKASPFVLLGVHTPEFTFEADGKNVDDAIARHHLTYPIAQDNAYDTWNAFANRYWPAKYLIDAQGYIRYVHFGEGGYDETDKAIASLLQEIGATATGALAPADTPSAGKPTTGETYLSSRSWPAFGNSKGEPSSSPVTYAAPAALTLNKYYLDGTWQLTDDEREVLQSPEGEIRIRALGGEVNLVLGLESGSVPVQAEVWVDGKKTSSFAIDRHDLFPLFKGDYAEHDVVLKIHGKGVGAYAFTFGG